MIQVRDTVLHFLSDNLTGIPVHPIRRDADNPSLELLQTNALNVQFLNMDLHTHVSVQQVVLDIINDNERVAAEWVGTVFALLSAAHYTPQLDYTLTLSPVETGTNLMWGRNVRFRRVFSESYTHYSCTLDVRFHPF